MCVLLLSEHILTQVDVKIQPVVTSGVVTRYNKLLYISLSGPVRAGKVGLAKPVWPARPASAYTFFKLRLNLVLIHRIPPESRRRYMGVFVVG